MFRLVAIIATALLLPSFVPPSSAQISNSEVIGTAPDDPQAELRNAMIARVAQSGLLALEGSIDPNEYIVGPGDIFNLIIGSVIPTELPLTVSVSGVLPLPEVGPVQAGGRSLAEVEQEAIKLLESRYVNAPVSITLAQARSFYVHVTGTVAQTGRYLMLPRSRVSDVVQQALSSGILTTRHTTREVKIDYAMPERGFLPEINEMYKPALRNIRVQHIDGSENLVDLTRYQTTGNTDHNPILRDGDRINVPAYHVVREGVRVSGDVAWPGLYDWRPDDTILNVLDLATGGRPLDEMVQFRIVRWSDGDYLTVLDHSIKSLKEDSIATQPLMPSDHITVYEHKAATAKIEGWVTYPGEYRIEGGATTLTQLVELAGGLKQGANPNAAILERTSAEKLMDPPETLLATQETLPLSDSKSAVLAFNKGFQRSYSGSIGSHVAVDIAGALAGNSEDIVLYNGDRLVFPRDEGTILVTGHVPRPGYITFVPGMPAHHYLERAGGLGPEVQEVYIYDGSSSAVRQGLNEPVRPGDTIFVDWLDELALELTLSERQLRSQRTQLFISSLVGIASLSLTTIILLNR